MDPLVLTTVAFLHIGFAIAWLGGSLYFAIILGPSLRTFSPPASMEFLARAGKSTSRYAEVVSSLTIVFGLTLLYLYFGGDYTKWPVTLEIGFTLGFIAYLEGLLVIAPTFNKASGFAKEFMKNPQQGPPPAEFLALMKKGGISSTIGTVLVLITAAFMVTTVFY